MNKLMRTGSLGLAGLVTTGLVAWQAPVAFADHGSDDSDDRGHHHSKAFKRDDDSQAVVTTVSDDDDDDTGARDTGTGTRTRTRTGAGTHSRRGDDSRGHRVRDLTNDGPGRANVDRSRHHTGDGTRHNTRG
jgi:hypothetical protein